jgi:hypothetical protein
MSEIKHSKSTDSENKIKMDSSLVYASWRRGSAYAGSKAAFEIGTSFVGNGAPVKVTVKNDGGKKQGKIKGKMRANIFIGIFKVPKKIEPGDKIYFEVELSKNGLNGKSNSIPVFPKPLITNMKWSAKKACRKDTMTLSADVKKVRGGTEAKIIIYEYDRDGAHDKITELPAVVENSVIEVEWEFEYHKDVDEIPTQKELDQYGGSYNPPEYFFVIRINDFVYGAKQESGLLEFEDWVELKLVNFTGKEKYVLHLPDGNTKKGKFDDKGGIVVEKTLPGRYYVEIKEEK